MNSKEHQTQTRPRAKRPQLTLIKAEPSLAKFECETLVEMVKQLEAQPPAAEDPIEHEPEPPPAA